VASYGGRVHDRIDARRQPVPVTAQYSVRAEVRGDAVPAMLAKTVAGVLIADGKPESVLAGLWRQALKVLVRESGV
jgi:hypothetical protein